MHLLLAIITGLTAGLHTSTWGMYKDSPHEGFTWLKYFRSTLLSVIYAPIMWKLAGLDLSTFSGIFLLWGCTYVAERLTVEVWKSFLRTSDQTKYFIPMQLHVFGKVVESKRQRYIAAFFYVLAIALICWAVINQGERYKAGKLTWSPYIIIFMLSIGGWISAFGGAWKDAPIEGFETFKFFRSPAIAYFWGWVAAHLTDNFLPIGLCSIGFTIATIETYKTFFFPNKPRGKFSGKPILYPEMLRKRQAFITVYVICWLYVIIFGVLAFTSPHQGLIAK